MVFKKVHENRKNAMQFWCCCTEWRLYRQKIRREWFLLTKQCWKWCIYTKSIVFECSIVAIGCNPLIGKCNSVLQWVNVTETIAPSQSLWNVHRFFIISIKYINKLKLISSAWYTHNGAHFFWFYFEALTACFEYTH